MNQREKILAISVACLLGYVAVQWFVKNRILEPLRERDDRLAGLEQQLDLKQKELQRAKLAELDINHWRSKALPANSSLAQTLYQEYLLDLCRDAGIENRTVTPSRVVARQGGENFMQRLPFTVKGHCNLQQLSRLLYAFYRADMLHQMRRIQIKPVIERDRLKEFDVTLSVEAVSMYDAEAKTKLPKSATSTKPSYASRTFDYFGLFPQKNPFQPTRIVRRELAARPSARQQNDERADYYFTGAVVTNGVGELWLTNPKTNQRLRVERGKEVKVGGMDAKLVEVSPREAVLQVAGQLGSIQLGNSLASWKRLTEVSQTP